MQNYAVMRKSRFLIVLKLKFKGHGRPCQAKKKSQVSLHRKGKREAMNEPDPRGSQLSIGNETFLAPVSYDGVHPGDSRAINTITWFSRTAILQGGENVIQQLALYAWEGQFYWSVEVEALASRVCRDVNNVDDVDLHYDRIG